MKKYNKARRKQQFWGDSLWKKFFVGIPLDVGGGGEDSRLFFSHLHLTIVRYKQKISFYTKKCLYTGKSHEKVRFDFLMRAE